MTIIFVVSVGLYVCLFMQSISQPSLIRFRSNLDICYMSGSSCVPYNIGAVRPLGGGWPLKLVFLGGFGLADCTSSREPRSVAASCCINTSRQRWVQSIVITCLYVSQLDNISITHMRKLHGIFCTCYPWPWLAHSLKTLQYVVLPVNSNGVTPTEAPNAGGVG